MMRSTFVRILLTRQHLVDLYSHFYSSLTPRKEKKNSKIAVEQYVEESRNFAIVYVSSFPSLLSPSISIRLSLSLNLSSDSVIFRPSPFLVFSTFSPALWTMALVCATSLYEDALTRCRYA